MFTEICLKAFFYAKGLCFIYQLQSSFSLFRSVDCHLSFVPSDFYALHILLTSSAAFAFSANNCSFLFLLLHPTPIKLQYRRKNDNFSDGRSLIFLINCSSIKAQLSFHFNVKRKQKLIQFKKSFEWHQRQERTV